MSAALAEYLDDCTARELRPSTVATTGHRLRTLLQVDDGRTGGPIADLTPARARRLVAAMVGPAERPRSVAYRRGALAEAGTWARWCVQRRYLRADPFDGLDVPGRARRGKPQLRIEEARRFAGHCLEAAAAGDGGALAAALCLLLGCRSSEVTDRVVRDVDDHGRVLWIPDAKTEAGRRRLEIPEVVRELLAAQARAAAAAVADPTRRGAAPLFVDAAGAAADRHWLRYHVARLCGAAGVASVCTQSLRGLHATLATAAGITAHAVAASLGHTSPVVTQRHYTQAEATAGAAQGRAFKVLTGGRP